MLGWRVNVSHFGTSFKIKIRGLTSLQQWKYSCQQNYTLNLLCLVWWILKLILMQIMAMQNLCGENEAHHSLAVQD